MRHILLAGPTASGKSAVAMHLAQSLDAEIVNTDALQVFKCWRILTARPSPRDEAEVPHRLYGHVDLEQDWSVGHWLKAVAEILRQHRQSASRLIFVGGTGLYFSALTEGLVDIPEIPLHVRSQGDAIRAEDGAAGFRRILMEADPETLSGLDSDNPMRLQRAWEVLTTTGRGLKSWQSETPPPLLGLHDVLPVVLDMSRETLISRISGRLDDMLDQGAIDEVKAVMKAGWRDASPSSQAIGAPELRDYLLGHHDLDSAKDMTRIATRRYAKRQRTWFRSRMKNWHRLDAEVPGPTLCDAIIKRINQFD